MRIIIREEFSRIHLNAAKLFAERCSEIEKEEVGKPFPQSNWHNLQSYAAATVISSCASLEAFVNELFSEAVDDRPIYLKFLSSQKLTLLANLWKLDEKYSILQKYQIILVACEKTPLGRGEEPYQSTKYLIELRNALVHFKPEWSDKLDEHEDLEKSWSKKFELNSLAPPSAAWFPGKCIGSGCANWAVAAVVEFQKVFCNTLGVDM